jgi:hypothetical protein
MQLLNDRNGKTRLAPTVLAAILVILAGILAWSTVTRITQLSIPNLSAVTSSPLGKTAVPTAPKAPSAIPPAIQVGSWRYQKICQTGPAAQGDIMKLPKGTASNATHNGRAIYLGTVGNFDYVYQFPTAGCHYLVN